MSDQVEQGTAATPLPRKEIPPSRDRLQSRAIVLTVASALSICIVIGVLATGDLGGRYQVAGISLLFAAIAGGLRSATIGGAVAGALACFCLTWWTRDLESPLLQSALPPLVALVVLTSIATRAGRPKKQLRGLAERSGGRNAAQVLANLGAAALAVTPIGAYAGALVGLPLPVSAPVLAAAALAALAEATADTVSSEIGQAFGTRTYMITSLRRVRRGTDGGVSIQGTFAGVIGALSIILVGGWSLHLSGKLMALSFVAAMIGFITDSLLGATIERRGWIGNDLVNLTSTVVAAFSFFLAERLASMY